jgi:hypothetical protein
MDVDYILNEKYTKNVFHIRLLVKQASILIKLFLEFNGKNVVVGGVAPQ